jgi:hypothetical protein
MSTPKRIYVVSQSTGTEVKRRLVRAATQAQAIRHVASATLAAASATQDDLVELVSKGVAVEEASGAEQMELPIEA